MTVIKQSMLTLPVTAMGKLSPVPQFAQAPHRTMDTSRLKEHQREGLGENTGFRVLPYAMQDSYQARPNLGALPVVTLENERLRATFLPSMGGRLYSLVDQRTNRECLYCNPEIITRNLALRNAWFSGGVEWNFGHFGHTFLTCENVFFAVCEADGQPFLRMYEFERCKELYFQVDFYLPEGAAALTAHLSVWNTKPTMDSIFLWTNTAVPQEKDMRVYSGTNEIIAQKYESNAQDNHFQSATLPYPFPDGVNAADPSNLKYSTEYFFQNPATTDASFEAVRYADGRFFCERSTRNMPYRKMFAWGTHQGGEKWQRFLSKSGGEYIEVQAGIARTQLHPAYIPPHQTLSITQQFTMGEAPPFDADYALAGAQARELTQNLLPEADLLQMHARALKLATQPAKEILHEGAGWGALERLRDAQSVPAHLRFPAETVGAQEKPWLALLQGKPFPQCPSFMVSKAWIPLMEAANANASLLCQLGVAYLENGMAEQAEAAFSRAGHTPLALYGLSVIHARQGVIDSAISLRVQAADVSSRKDRYAFVESVLTLLNEHQRFAQAYQFYLSLPKALQKRERISLLAAESACVAGDDAFLAHQYRRNFSVIKEGELAFIQTWFVWEARRIAAQEGVPVTEALIERVRATRKPPRRIDFRMAE